MRIFSTSVDKRSRKAMTNFLANHFRYSTVNSWNNSTSYACNLKVHHLGLEHSVTNTLYDRVQTSEFYEPINALIDEFDFTHNYAWHAGFNGRSGGYLVLYQSQAVPSGYKSYCIECGQQNFKSVTENGSICGRCGNATRRDYSQTHMRMEVFSGRSTDQWEDYDDWDLSLLRDRVELVCEFDSLADRIVAEAVYMAENYPAAEELVYIPHTRLVMAEI